jgi:hypothetical protein
MMGVKMTIKIRMKMGPIEIEYEGSENFLKEELPELLRAVSKLYKESGLTDKSYSKMTKPDDQTVTEKEQPAQLEATTGSIAAKLQCKTGPDLILAAASRLTFVLGKEKFTREDLIKEMKSASSYYKKTYSGGNLTKYLSNLLKKCKLNEPSQNNYSLSASEISEIGAKIA